jgi:hypothetical protein
MIRKFLIVFTVVLIAAGSMVQAEPVKSMSATNVRTSFGGGIGSVLAMSGVGGINCEYLSGFVNTYGNAQFGLNTTLMSDNSSGSIASGDFAGGSFSYMDAGSNVLLSGTIVSFNLTEIYDNSGMFAGQGYFNVSGGTLQPDFGSEGKLVDITFSVTPNTISNFSSPGFTGSTNMTVLPVPEPATICLLGLGVLSLIRRKKRRGNYC